MFVCVFNLPEEDTFSEVMLLPRSLTPLTDALLSCSSFPHRGAKANSDMKLETSTSWGNTIPVFVHSEKENPNARY